MTFANLSPLAVIGGIAALAGVLYALQWLRIRHRQQKVVTMLFWREAIDDAPVRTFWHQFRHWWAYLLILSICSLLWVALAEPEAETREGSNFTVMLVDGSAGMARAGRFESMIEALKSDLSSLPRDQRQVIWAGGQARTLLNPGEHELLLEKRLENLQPEAAPASIEQQLRQLAVTHRDERQVHVQVYGDAPVRESLLALMPASVKVKRVTDTPEKVAGNSGITSLGIAEAASGNWHAVDLYFQIEGDDVYVAGPESLQVELDGKALDRTLLQPVAGAKAGAYQISDLPAKGGLLSVRITQDDNLALDNEASVRLPVKEPIKVQLSGSLLAELQNLLAIDPAIELVNGGGDVVIRRRGEAIGGSLPALEFVAAERQQQAFVLGYPESANGDAFFDDEGFMNAVQTIGLDQIDATGLAQIAQRPIKVSAAAGDQWRFSLWQELLTGNYNFVQSRAFPLFISNSVRWLAGVQSWVPYAVAGEPLMVNSTGQTQQFTNTKGVILNTLGGALVPAAAGEMARASGEPSLAVSLLDGNLTRNDMNSALSGGSVTGVSLPSRDNLVAWLLLAVLLLVGFEWFLYQKGRMP